MRFTQELLVILDQFLSGILVNRLSGQIERCLRCAIALSSNAKNWWARESLFVRLS